MRLGWTTGKYTTTYRAVKTIRIDGKNKTIIVKNFGSEKSIKETYGVEDAKAWAKEQVQKMSEAEQIQEPSFDFTLNAAVDLEMNSQTTFNGGYLFLQTIYHQLGFDQICAAIRTRYHFDYNLNAILSRLLYTR
ncbi:MAG: transposase, partial [Eubacteriales bacterium]|nr:transposase [Eubacteriales bacterium]